MSPLVIIKRQMIRCGISNEDDITGGGAKVYRLGNAVSVSLVRDAMSDNLTTFRRENESSETEGEAKFDVWCICA